MELSKYREKRNFSLTPEPSGDKKGKKNYLVFVVHKHNASHLHYDLRLEAEGVLKSWAIPKGPSVDPQKKTLAMMVEDHPLDYRFFEGTIPEGNYGAGQVIIWDAGTYHSVETKDKKESNKKILEGIENGHISFILKGEKLKGEFALVKMKKAKNNSWLLLKKKDKFSSKKDILKKDESVKSGKKIEDLKRGNSVIKSRELVEMGAKRKKMPKMIKPMLATLTDNPFNDNDWIYELKWDGYRAIARIEKSRAELISRNNKKFKQFESVNRSLSRMKESLILDGELVVVDEKGKSNFQLLQNYLNTKEGNLIYYIFDILFYNGYELTELPLEARKDVLSRIISELDNIKISDYIRGEGVDFFEEVRKSGLEGVIAKNLKSKYLSGSRSKKWLKIKTHLRQEVVVGGYTQPRGSRKHIGSLLTGVYENGKLVYTGHASVGEKEEKLSFLKNKMNKLKNENSPFENTPKTNQKAVWIKPKLVGEVKFTEWTKEGSMRHPIFLGFREDKNPKEVKREKSK